MWRVEAGGGAVVSCWPTVWGAGPVLEPNLGPLNPAGRHRSNPAAAAPVEGQSVAANDGV